MAWADAFLIVYSIIDETSFKEAINLTEEVLASSTTYRPAIFIVGNKKDLDYERTVPKEEASRVVQEHNCCFTECSASHDYEEVCALFHELYHESMRRRKEKRMSLSPRPLRKAFNKVFGGKVPPRENFM